MHSFVQTFYRAAHRLITTRAIPVTPLLLAGCWLFILYRGERSIFTSAIAACEWSTWESWPEDSRPHRAILIADPQLVDPHTYPGRPWPLSSLTERYTDRYMARSYRLINENYDPDSIIFLGDMLDGGREWETTRARPLSKMQKWVLNKLSPATEDLPVEPVSLVVEDPGWPRSGQRRDQDKELTARDIGSASETHPLDLTKFVHGEDGRWSAYGRKQWESEYKRFGDIFLSPSQLYPHPQRSLEASEIIAYDPHNVDNGARRRGKQHYKFISGKKRDVLASLPGNHDLGFGSGVQMPVRARYKWHFGELNRLDILGNHSFVSIDALSLAAWSQYKSNGQETVDQGAAGRTHIYAPAQQFLDNLPSIASKALEQTLTRLYPDGMSQTSRVKHMHDALNISDLSFPQPEDRQHLSGVSELPVILLTHVPLYREPDTPCGPLRERGQSLSITGGYQYQNVLTPTLSNAIFSKLAKIGPLRHVFSGDDHDYCSVMHEYGSGSKVQEETVKSFSWAMGVRRPGFLMLSLWNPLTPDGQNGDMQSTMQTHLCLLPDQLAIFLHYASMLGLTITVLLVRAIVLALRGPAIEDIDSDPETTIPMLQKLVPAHFSNGNGGSVPKIPSRHRHRASSSGLKPISNGHLGVQRSTNARNRSVSPAYGVLKIAASPFSTPTRPLIEQAGYYGPELSDDEESKVGDMDYFQAHDSQAKWRRRKRSRGRFRRALDEFASGLVIVAAVALPWYIFLISRG